MSRKATQCDRILQYMQEFNSITDRDAYNVIHCRRLSARIFDLKKRGHAIKTSIEHGKDESGVPYSYARYSLMGKAVQ